MAVRAAELGLPAAIGVGELLYEALEARGRHPARLREPHDHRGAVTWPRTRVGLTQRADDRRRPRRAPRRARPAVGRIARRRGSPSRCRSPTCSPIRRSSSTSSTSALLILTGGNDIDALPGVATPRPSATRSSAGCSTRRRGAGCRCSGCAAACRSMVHYGGGTLRPRRRARAAPARHRARRRAPLAGPRRARRQLVPRLGGRRRPTRVAVRRRSPPRPTARSRRRATASSPQVCVMWHPERGPRGRRRPRADRRTARMRDRHARDHPRRRRRHAPAPVHARSPEVPRAAGGAAAARLAARLRCGPPGSTTSRSSPGTAPTRSPRSGARPCTTPTSRPTNMVASLCAPTAVLDGSDDVIVAYGDLVYEPRHRAGAGRVRCARRDHRRSKLAPAVGAAHGRSARRRRDAADRRRRQRGRAGPQTRRAYADIEGQYMGLIGIRARDRPETRRRLSFALDPAGPTRAATAPTCT